MSESIGDIFAQYYALIYRQQDNIFSAFGGNKQTSSSFYLAADFQRKI